MPDYPLRILIRVKHNHSVSSAAALRYRDVDESVCQKFKHLFKSGYSPSSAYLLHQYDLQNDCDTQYYIVGGDRRWNSDRAWCYKFLMHTLFFQNLNSKVEYLWQCLQTWLTFILIPEVGINISIFSAYKVLLSGCTTSFSTRLMVQWKFSFQQ